MRLTFCPSSLRLLLCALGASASTGCVSLKIQTERVKATKSVAVVGYTSAWEAKRQNNNRKSGGITGAISGVKNMTKTFSGEAANQAIERATGSYDLLVDRLGSAMNWKILTREDLLANGDYKNRFETLAAPGRKGFLSRNSGRMMVDGVLDYEHVSRMSPADRRALIEALGVDAIAAARLMFREEKTGFAVGGLGNEKYHPAATVVFHVFDKNSDEPIWLEPGVRGERTELIGAQVIAGVPVDKDMTAAVVDAAGRGYEALLRRYNNYEPPES